MHGMLQIGLQHTTSLGITSFDCAGGHQCGHTAFDWQLFQNVLSGHTNKRRLLCKNCVAKPTYKCEAENCQIDRSRQMGPWEFGAEQVQQKKKRSQSKMICKHCVALGFSNIRGGTVAYQCDGCNRRLGHQSFAKSALNNAKKRGGKLSCLTCQERPRRV